MQSCRSCHSCVGGFGKTRKRAANLQVLARDRPKSTTPKKQRANSAKKSRSRNNSRGKVREDDPLTETGLAAAGEEDGWDETAMFKANERILGRKITYDGNPHYFAEKGFDGMDPHAFHVVGGSFMNSGGITKLAPPPQQSKLQPLFRKEAEEGELQPFFSQGGETPWGEVVSDAQAEDAKKTKKSKKKGANEQAPEDAGRALLKILQKGGGQQSSDSKAATNDSLDIFMTDAEITARSQQEKAEESNDTLTAMKQKRQANLARDRDTRASLRKWVKDLPQAPATSQFGDFRFDVDAIMNAMARS